MAILAAVLVPTITNKINDANKSSANQTASAIANSVQSEIVSIISGVSSPDNKYVKGTNGVVDGLKDGITSGTQFEDGKAKIKLTYTATSGATHGTITVDVEVSGQPSPTYTVDIVDGKVTQA